MKRLKIILWLLALALSANAIQAQENREERRDPPVDFIVPPDGFPPPAETYTFSEVELQVSESFVDSLNAVLFDAESDSVEDAQSYKYWELFFRKKDTLNYNIIIAGNYHPGRQSWVFFESCGALYSLYGDRPPGNIILETKSAKQFSYTTRSSRINWVYWNVMYNCRTGKITLMEKTRLW